VNEKSYDIEQCNTTNVTCDRSNDINLSICDANVIEVMRGNTNESTDTNITDTGFDISDPKSNNVNSMYKI